MRSIRRWLGISAAVAAILALVPLMRGRFNFDSPLRSIRHGLGPAKEMPKLEGLDLMRLDIRPERVLAPLAGGKTAELTLDPGLQRSARGQMQRYRVPEGGVVVIEVKTGRVLAYASYVNEGEKFDVNARAEAPAASIFKMVTGAALVERAGLSADTEQCYHGGKSRILPQELLADPRRDKWCATLGEAMGRSLNVVFGRLAQKHLTPEDIAQMGGAFGFGSPIPFAATNDAPHIEVPSEPLEFARTSAGFWNTSLSPLAAALMAQTVANGGVALEPRIVSRLLENSKEIWHEERPARVLRRAIKAETASELTRMMGQTVSNGSAFKSFHDDEGRPYLPGIQVAGKTGTLTRYKENRHYTWFVGFAPLENPEIAVSTLIVNTPNWQIKAPQLAREVLRAYFAQKGHRGISSPS